MWIGAERGLNRFDRGTGRFERINPAGDSAGGSIPILVRGIHRNRAGALWLTSTEEGLTRFDPRTGAVRNYTSSDGLQGDEFHQLAFFQARDGEIYFGGINGVTAFQHQRDHRDQRGGSTESDTVDSTVDACLSATRKMLELHNDLIRAAMKRMGAAAAVLFMVAAMPMYAQATSRLEPSRLEPATHVSPGARMAAGTHVLELRFAGIARRYVLHVPAGLDPERPSPLVIVLHGGGGHAEYMADDVRYALIGKADRAGFVVVFPNGYSKLPRGRLATWNAGDCCGGARDAASDDVGFVRALVAEVGRLTRIDRERVFATGMSNGGMMAYRLACEAADMVRAVASVAGTEAVPDCRPSRAVPVLHIHARNDTHVLFDGGAGAGAFRDTSKIMDFVSVLQTIARWVERNECARQPRRTLEKPGAYCEAYGSCRDGGVVQLCVTERGGHSWPGAPDVRRGKEAPSQALDANDTIWEFFRASATR